MAARLKFISDQQLTSLSASSSLTVPSGATIAFISADVQNIKWRDGSGVPTSTVGHTIFAGTDPTTFLTDLSALRFIEVTASAKLNVSYYCNG